MNQNEELYHYGVLGMKWGKRKATGPSYHSTGIRSAIARRQNEKVDKNFKKWKENADKRENAIELGKKTNIARINYEKNKSDKSLKSAYKSANKEYKKALKSNTTYRKGQIKKEVGSDISRKYLSEAKKIKKQLNSDPSNKSLQKQYNDLMSKHDVERAKARRAPEVAANRSRTKANMKRAMTMTVKAAAISTAVAGGTYIVNSYLNNHQVTFNGKSIRIGTKTISSMSKAIKIGQNILKYF